MTIFEEFKQYITEKGYDINILSDTSIRGIKGQLTKGFIVHLFFDYKYDEFNLYVSEDGYKLWNSVFIPYKDGYKLNHKDDKRTFCNLTEIINFTNSKLDTEI